MTIPQHEVDRTEAVERDFELKFWIGGQRHQNPEWSIWARDWDNYHVGLTDFDITTTLATVLTPGDSSEIALTDASSFLTASTGYPQTVFIEPYDKQTNVWERIIYEDIDYNANKLESITRHARNVWPPSGFHHPSGATVHQFVDVSDRLVGDFDFPWTQRGNVFDWRTMITGLAFNRELFARGNTLICQARYDIFDGNGWSAWITLWGGYIVSTSTTRESEDGNPFNMNVGSISVFANKKVMPAHNIGKQNIFLGKTVTTSSRLLIPELEASGEFYGTADVSGDRAVDGDPDTPWISEGAPSKDDQIITLPDGPNGGYQDAKSLMISEIYFNPSAYTDRIWIEIYNPRPFVSTQNPGTKNIGGWFVTCPSSTFEIEYARTRYDIGDLTAWPPPKSVFIPLPNVDIPAEGHLVMCLNLGGFSEWWTILGQGDVYDWRIIAETWEDTLQIKDINADQVSWLHEGGWLQLRDSITQGIIDEVFWGGGTVAAAYPDDVYYDPPTNSAVMSGFDPATALWQGAAINADGAIDLQGKSIRRVSHSYTTPNYENTDLDDFVIEDFPSPGAHKTFQYGEYISVDVGLVPTQLSADLEITDTIAEVSGGTIAFPEFGSFVVGQDQVSFASKTADQFTDTSGVGQTYPAGTPVWPVDENGLATQYYPVRSIVWRRPKDRPAPLSYQLYGSTETSPRYPSVPSDEQALWSELWGLTAAWRNDWEEIGGIRNNNPDSGDFANEDTWNAIGRKIEDRPYRYRHYMLGVYTMTDGGRVKIGEFEGIADTVEHTDGDGNDHGFEGTTVHDVLRHFYVDHMDISPDKFTTPDEFDPNDPTNQDWEYKYILNNFNTQKAPVGRVTSDLARIAGMVIVYQPTFGVRVKIDPQNVRFYDTENAYTFTEDGAENVNIDFPVKNSVSQVELYAENQATNKQFHVFWPDKPNRYGEPLVIRDAILYDLQDAIDKAHTEFRRSNYQSRITFSVKGFSEWLAPTMKIVVTVDNNQDMEYNPYLKGMKYIVTGVVWSIRTSDPENKVWDCAVQAEQQVLANTRL